MILHSGLIAFRINGAWRGALVSGASGTGKTDLMLRALEHGFRLAADDRTQVWASGGRLFGRAPDRLLGLIELRGLGVLREPSLPLAQISIAVRCEAFTSELERVPEGAWRTIEGVKVPLLKLHALDASAPAKLSRALMRLGQGLRAA